MVMMRSGGFASAGRARSIVVLPASVPPETMMLSRARTAARRNRANSSLIESARSSRVGSTRRCRRIETHGRFGHLDHGREPVAAGQVEVDDGLGGVDPSFSAGVVRPGGPLDQLDQVRVAVGDRFDLLFGPVGPLDPHVVASVDVDVLDVVVVQEQLEAAETELGGHQAADDLVLLFGTRRGDAPLDHGAGGLVDSLAGELLDEGAAIAFAHARRAVADDAVGDVLGGVGLELSAFGVVHVAPSRSIRLRRTPPRRGSAPTSAPRPTAPVSPQRGALVRVVVLMERGVDEVSCVGDLDRGRLLAARCFGAHCIAVHRFGAGCFDAQCPDERGGPLEQRGALEPLDERTCWPARPRPCDRRASAGRRRRQGPADLGPRIAPRAGGDDQELTATQLDSPGRAEPARRWTIPSSVGWHRTTRASLWASTSPMPPAKCGRSRPASTTTSASRAPSASATAGQAFSLATAPATPERPKRTGRPPGRRSTWSQTASGLSDRRAAANSEAKPRAVVEPKRGARSPPKGSASTRRTRRPLGQLAPSAVAAVVTPGEPLSEARVTTVTSSPRSPARARSGRLPRRR